MESLVWQKYYKLCLFLTSVSSLGKLNLNVPARKTGVGIFHAQKTRAIDQAE